MKKVQKYLFAFVVVLLILWLASLSPKWYRDRGYDAMVKADLKNLHVTSQSYFSKNPDGTMQIDDARKYGFKPTNDVKLEIKGGQRLNFFVIGYHKYGSKVFTINRDGDITSQKRTP